MTVPDPHLEIRGGGGGRSQNIYSALQASVRSKGRYTLGDKLQQHVAATYYSMCTGRATSCSNKVRRQIASCVLENFSKNLCLRNKILSLQQVAKNQIRLNLCDLLRRQNSVAATKIFRNFSSTHEAICRCNVSPRHVAATCRLVCTDLDPPLDEKQSLKD